MRKSIQEDFEKDGKFSTIYLTKGLAGGLSPNENYYMDGSEEIIPDVPIQLLKRLDEWERMGTDDETGLNEYRWLVGALNYFLKGKYEVKTDYEDFGTPISDMNNPLEKNIFSGE